MSVSRISFGLGLAFVLAFSASFADVVLTPSSNSTVGPKLTVATGEKAKKKGTKGTDSDPIVIFPPPPPTCQYDAGGPNPGQGYPPGCVAP